MSRGVAGEGGAKGEGEKAGKRAAEHDRRHEIELAALARSTTTLIAAANGIRRAIAIPSEMLFQ